MIRKIKLLTAAALIMTIVSCKENDSASGLPVTTELNESIVFTCNPDNNVVSFRIVTQNMSVDWGDETPVEEYNNSGYVEVAHIYADNAEYTVRILACGTTEFYCGRGIRTVLNTDNCTELTLLECSSNPTSDLN
jgi:hypothetical protein